MINVAAEKKLLLRKLKKFHEFHASASLIFTKTINKIQISFRFSVYYKWNNYGNRAYMFDAKMEHEKKCFMFFVFVAIRHTNDFSDEHSQAWVVVEFMRICAHQYNVCSHCLTIFIENLFVTLLYRSKYGIKNT